jgi:hypothetical protein
MKNILSILALTLVIATGCKSSKANAYASGEKVARGGTSYEYHAYTRGTKLDIVIKDGTIAAHKGRPGEAVAEPREYYVFEDSILTEKASKINLDNLETLEVPSKKHQFDGAMAATLTITANGKTYTTPTFDHGNPPAEVKPLVDKIIEISGLEKE